MTWPGKVLVAVSLLCLLLGVITGAGLLIAVGAALLVVAGVSAVRPQDS